MKQLKVNTLTPLVEFLINSKTTGIINDGFVDLELSVLWAKCNIGAKEETDYGHYYQLGGLEPMDNKKCSWKYAPFNNGKTDFDEKYFDSIKDKICSHGILDKEYDIAYQTYKGKIHMPTDEDFVELISDTKNKWINNYNDSGINGRLFTAKNGNSIFIPAAGGRYNNKFHFKGSYAFVWSSRVDTGSCNAENLYFDENIVDSYYYNNRCHGFSVRAVKDK